jgi:hypothetical protein
MIEGQCAGHPASNGIRHGLKRECDGDKNGAEQENGILPDDGVSLGRRDRQLVVWEE